MEKFLIFLSCCNQKKLYSVWNKEFSLKKCSNSHWLASQKVEMTDFLKNTTIEVEKKNWKN